MRKLLLISTMLIILPITVWARVPRRLPPCSFEPAICNFLSSLRNDHNVLEHIEADPNNPRFGPNGYHIWATFDSIDHLCMNTSGTPLGGTTWQCISRQGELALRSASAVIENLAAADDNQPLGSVNDAITITSVWCTCTGTCTTAAQITLEDGSGNAMTHTAPICTDIGTIPTAQSITVGGGLVARESLRFDVDNTPSPETDTYEINWDFTIDD